MTEFYSGDPLRVQHFMKVHAYSALIARLEGLWRQRNIYTRDRRLHS